MTPPVCEQRARPSSRAVGCALAGLLMAAGAGCAAELLEPPEEAMRHLRAVSLDRAINDEVTERGVIAIAIAGGYAFEWTVMSASLTDELVSRGTFPISGEHGVWVLGVTGRIEDGPFRVEIVRLESTASCGCGSDGRADVAYQVVLRNVLSRSPVYTEQVCVGGSDVWVDYGADGIASRFFGFAPTVAEQEVGCVHYAEDAEEHFVGGQRGRSHETAGAVFARTGGAWTVETSSTPRAVYPDRRFVGRFQGAWTEDAGWGREVGVDTEGRRLEMRECWGPSGHSRRSSDETVWTSSNAAAYERLCGGR